MGFIGSKRGFPNCYIPVQLGGSIHESIILIMNETSGSRGAKVLEFSFYQSPSGLQSQVIGRFATCTAFFFSTYQLLSEI